MGRLAKLQTGGPTLGLFIDEGEWEKIYKATSVPFAAPKSGKIAVKVVNHYGDEVLKVYNAG